MSNINNFRQEVQDERQLLVLIPPERVKLELSRHGPLLASFLRNEKPRPSLVLAFAVRQRRRILRQFHMPNCPQP
jgi:hypothetical protein